jgi:hypothetical protein
MLNLYQYLSNILPKRHIIKRLMLFFPAPGLNLMRVQFGPLQINFALITKQGIFSPAREQITRHINVQRRVAIKCVFMWSLNANLVFMQIQRKFLVLLLLYSFILH